MKLNDKVYRLEKLRSKGTNRSMLPDSGFIITGYAKVAPNKSLVVNGVGRSDHDLAWFTSSTIVKSKKIKNGFEFETLNSVYKLTQTGE